MLLITETVQVILVCIILKARIMFLPDAVRLRNQYRRNSGLILKSLHGCNQCSLVRHNAQIVLHVNPRVVIICQLFGKMSRAKKRNQCCPRCCDGCCDGCCDCCGGIRLRGIRLLLNVALFSPLLLKFSFTQTSLMHLLYLLFLTEYPNLPRYSPSP